jgi:hypothetical protein
VPPGLIGVGNVPEPNAPLLLEAADALLPTLLCELCELCELWGMGVLCEAVCELLCELPRLLTL